MKQTNNKLIYFIAGEPSGDLHGSNLIKAIKNQSNNLNYKFRGLGGPLMQDQGLINIEKFDRLAVMGFVEVIKDLFFFLKLKRKIIVDIFQHKPEKIILIDYPGFNLSIAESIKKQSNIKIYYYISPQLWAWKESRIEKIKKYVDEMIVIFPFEIPWYKSRGLFNVQYFGHPLVDIYNPKEYKSKPNIITIGLFPGSRKQEIKKHLPIINNTIYHLENLFSDSINYKNFKLRFIVGVLKNSLIKNKDIKISSSSELKFEQGSFQTYEKCHVCLVASGTATLECAITKTPMVVFYKTSFLSWCIAKKLIKVDFASIVNIIAEEEIIPEYLQKDCVGQQVAGALKRNSQFWREDYDASMLDTMWNTNKNGAEVPYIKQKKDMQKVINKLGDGRAYEKTAKFILNNEKN